MVIKAPVDRSLSLFFYFSSQKKILTAKQAQLGYSGHQEDCRAI